MKKAQLKVLKQQANHIFDALSTLQEVLEDAREKYDSRSEKWQESEAGEKLQAAIDYLESVTSELESNHDTICDILSTYEYE